MSWFNILRKLPSAITRSGRQSLARDLLKQYMTPETLTELSVKGVNSLLEYINKNPKLDTIAGNVELASETVGKIAAAVRDGRVSTKEAEGIVASAKALSGEFLTAEQLDRIVEMVVAHVS